MKKINRSLFECLDWFLRKYKTVNAWPNFLNDFISLSSFESAFFWANINEKMISPSKFFALCKKLSLYAGGEPVPYLNKKVFFFNDYFKIDKGVFIPQKDTEVLLELFLQTSSSIFEDKEKIKVLEIGIGCGNISLSLAKIKKQWLFTGVDINKKALKISRKNLIFHNIKNCSFKISNLFESLKGKKFNIIISNPPYLSEKEYENLEDFRTKIQPKSALVAPEEGYYYLEKIITQSRFFLEDENKFIILLEIGFQDEKTLLELARKNYKSSKVFFFNDLSNLKRVLLIIKTNEGEEKGLVAQLVRALDWRSRGQQFDSASNHQNLLITESNNNIKN